MRQALGHLAIGALALVLGLSGVLTPLHNTLVDARFAATSRPATGSVVLVAIDAKSIDAVGVWPWPRRLHGELIDRLRDAGVSEIAFDIDFSSASTPSDDAALEAALKRAQGSVILAAFSQARSAQADETVQHVNRPLPQLARHAWPAVVNVFAEFDGQLRHFNYGRMLGGSFHPSIPALLGGRVDRASGSFQIDFAIDPATVPRVSYADVLDGSADAAVLKSAKVIVGGTAVELGDRFSVPVYGIMAGPMVQVLATESILQGRTLRATGTSAAAIVLIVIAGLLAAFGRRLRWRHRLALLAAGAAAVELGALAVQSVMPIVVDTSAVLVALLLYGAMTLVREIDFRKILLAIAQTKTENTRRVLKRVIADNFAGIVICDQTGCITAASSAGAEILGLPGRRALIGRRFHQILPEAMTAAGREALEGSAENGPGTPREIKFTRGDGTERELEFVVTPSRLEGYKTPDGAPVDDTMVVTFTFRDVTEQKQAQRAMAAATEAAIAANRAKTNFLANMSHELRTPLNAVLGFAEIIRDQSLGPVGDPSYADFGGEIHTSGSQLLHVLNAILDISRLETGAVELAEQEMALDDVLASALAAGEKLPEFADRSIDVALPGDLPWLLGDQKLIKGVMLHLLSNALKFSAADTPVTVSGQLADDGSLVLEIIDRGIGIAPDLIEKVREPFFQVEAERARQFEGNGLGLALAAGHVEAHGGRLEIDSAPGEGTTVRAVFPPDRVVTRSREPAEPGGEVLAAAS